MALGTENLKRICKVAVDFAEQCNTSFADGAQPADLASFADDAFAIATSVGTFKDVKAEIKDLTAAEIKEVQEYIAKEFDIPNDKAEELVEAILAALVANATVGFKVKALKA